MDTTTVTFSINDNEVLVHGYPELEGCEGYLSEDGMALFFGKGGEFHIANTLTGNIRKISAAGGYLMVDDCDIDYHAIAIECPNGLQYAERKYANYARVNTWDRFKGGLCAISWMLYPDGMYFADSDGYGMKDNDEENVYAIINTDLEIVEPFRPIKDVTAYLKEKRKNRLK